VSALGYRLAAVALAAVSVGWLDPYGKAREAARLYAAGQYDDAAGRYDEALTDQPDSALLHFNRGDAAYRQGKYADAVNAFQEVPTSDADPDRTARVAYNTGNAKFRLGQAAEASDPKAALGLYAEAVVAYRRALGAAPDDVDAKFNHEFVEKKIADLKQKLEEQQKQQEEQKQKQKDEQKQDGQDQQKQPDEQKQQGDQQSQDANQQQQEGQKADQKPQTAEPQQSGQRPPSENAARSDGGEGMTQQEAAALLDSQRDQEIEPGEMAKHAQGVVVGEPAEDW
jgi:Ca-activated chloride channel homolog